MDLLTVLCGIAVVLLAVYCYLTSNFDFWESRGVRGPRPIPIFGTMKDVLLVKTSLFEYVIELCRTYKDEPLIGTFFRKKPILVVKDPDLIKDVLIKDFTAFADRGNNTDEKILPLSLHLFNLEPRRWRPLRTKLTPVFTSGKLKEMFHLISECADDLEKYTEKLASKNEPVECREVTAKYTTDVIGRCVFGIEAHSLADEDAEFRRMGRLVFAPTWENVLRFMYRHDMPKLISFLNFIGFVPVPIHNIFFARVLRENMDYREKNNIVRHDFVDVLRDLKKQGKVGDIELTDNLIASQAFVFFIAGFETSSSTISNALYELALHSEIQDKLREEINEIYTKHGSDLTYDNVKEMQYLDKVFKETLRKYPPLVTLKRTTTTNYTFNGTNVIIPNEQQIMIPVVALHYDPNIYPKPDVFDPERFNNEAVKARHPMFYLPFGDGPRNCIGARFGTYQTKIGLIKLLKKFKFETCEETQIPYRVNPKAVVLAPQSGIVLKITKIDKA